MAWCRVSSLIAAVSVALKGRPFPLTRAEVIERSAGKEVEGWELEYFLTKALRRRIYPDLKTVVADLSDWLEAQA